MKKILLKLLTSIFVICMLVFLGTACSDNGEIDSGNNEIYSIYTTYVAYAESNGETPLSYEEWLTIIKGEKGEAGEDGVDGVSPKLQINSSTNMWEISYDDGKTWTSLNVKATGENGINGTDGKDGVDGVSPKLQINGSTNMWEISYDDGKTWTSLNVKATGENGINGTDGKDGVDGVSPKLQINGSTNMWEISYDDGKTWTSLNVKATGENGINGTDGKDGVDGVSPKLQINGSTNMWEISYDNGKTWTSLDVKATGENGFNGADGLSAYELFKKYNPSYAKSEGEWLEDLVSGALHVINIEIDGNGGNTSDTNVITTAGSYISIDPPVKNGYDFVGWSLNGSLIDVNTYVFFTDCTLKAVWKDAEKVNVFFNAEGGIVSPVKTIIEYNKSYSLPTPSKEYQTFAGWYYLDTLIPQTGTWEYTHEDITLTAKWDKTNIYANLSVDAEYGSVDKTKVTLAIGDYYTLPIPSSLKEGESFQGWYYGDIKVTDNQGKSFKKCTWDSTVFLTAAYYTEISTIYEFMDLAGKDLVGKYIITQDLDFKGLGVNCINSLTGTFDGGGHTLKNFTLSTGASYNTYSGLFKTVKNNSTICNMVFENVNCSEQYASGLVGTMCTNSNIDNITIKNSFNNYSIRAVLVGKISGQSTVYNSSYKTYTANGDVYIHNIIIENSGNLAYTYGIYTQSATEASDYSNSGYKYYFYSNINIDGFYLKINNTNQSAGGVLFEVPIISQTASFYEKYYPQRELNISNLKIDGNIANGVVANGTGSWKIFSLKVQKAEINGITKIAWSGVNLLEDSIHTGSTQEWGAAISVRCIDAGAEVGAYDLGEISSSIILYPDANGVYTYYSASGTQATFNDASLIDKNLFKSMLGFDETVWDLDHIDIANGVYPSIRSEQE